MLRRVFSIIPAILVLGSLVALVFVNISGVTSSSFMKNIYFSKAEVNGDEYQWSMYALCQGSLCSTAKPAYPYSPEDNFGESSVPDEFVTHRKTYYYVLRFGYAMLLGAGVFTLAAFVAAAVGVCVPSGIFATSAVAAATIFCGIGAAMETAIHVKGVKVFQAAGYSAKIGTPMFICMWVPVALLALAGISRAILGTHRAPVRHEPCSESDLESKY